MLLNKRISILYFLKLIRWDLIAIFCYATLIGTLDNFAFFKDISVPLSVSALIGTLLSLLLAFRTSQSYERWWEARVIWGAVVNDSRTLIRQLVQFLPDSDTKAATVRRFAVRQSMWCHALTHWLRKDGMPASILAYKEQEGIKEEHLPNALLTRHALDLAAISATPGLNPNLQVQLDATIQRLTDAMGRCERIKNTVFPRSYSVFIHFLIYVLMTILPFGLEDNHPIVETALVTLIPALFIVIERTAILMQDPFENQPTDTPMTAISISIERTLTEMSGLPTPEAPAPATSYYLM